MLDVVADTRRNADTSSDPSVLLTDRQMTSHLVTDGMCVTGGKSTFRPAAGTTRLLK